MLNKKKWILLLLLLMVISVFDVFVLTPLARISIYFLLFTSTIGHFLFFRYKKFITKKIKFWYWLGLLMMFISILTTNLYYGQSLVSGFVANVNYYYVGSAVLFVYLFQKYRITFPDLFSVLTKAGWVILIMMTFMAITGFVFVNESELTGKIVLVNANTVNKGFVNFIGIYWFSMFLKRNNYRYLIYSLIFFTANHFGEVQRFSLIVTLIIIGIGLLKNKNMITNLKLIIPAFFTLFLLSIFLSNSAEGATVLDRFYEASKVFTGDTNQISDDSTAARIYETEFALEMFKQHPLLGNGMHRASEFEKVIDEDVYFHVNDIGIFGILYVFGIFGLLVFLLQLDVLRNYFKWKRMNNYTLTFVLVLTHIMISTLLSGTSIIKFTIFYFCVCLIPLTNLRNTKMKQ